MENRFTLRLSRMFRSSFGSCRKGKISDVIQKTVLTTQTHNTLQLFNTSPSQSPPKAPPFTSICKPKRHEPTRNAVNHDITPTETILRRKVLARYPPFVVSGSGSAIGFDGRKCPAGNNPLLPLNLFSDCKDFGFYEKKKSIARHKTKKKKKRVHFKSKNTSTSAGGATFFSSSSRGSANHYYNNHHHSGRWWLSSEEDETETLFSSRNLSSDSSESFTGRHHHRRRFHRERCSNARRRRPKNRSCNMGVLPLEGAYTNTNQVRDSFAVVKRSSDPYNDFMTSMVEMIVEGQLFGAEDLEHLLQCFLSLNSRHHHRIILEVFTEIWETLFSYKM